MNFFKILYYSLKMSISNMILKIKEFFKKKPKPKLTQCYISEAELLAFHVINLLREIKVVDFKEKLVNTFKDFNEVFESYPSIKTVYYSVMLQNVLKRLSEKNQNMIINIQDFPKNLLVFKVHMLNLDIFGKLFVIPEHQDKFNTMKNSIVMMEYIGKDGNNYILALKTVDKDGKIIPIDTVRTLTNFKSIIDIITDGKDEEFSLYVLNEKFINFINEKINKYKNNDEILNTILVEKDIDDFIIENKII